MALVAILTHAISQLAETPWIFHIESLVTRMLLESSCHSVAQRYRVLSIEIHCRVDVEQPRFLGLPFGEVCFRVGDTLRS